MDERAVVVGIYLALEKAGARNLVERTRKAARAAGVSFTNAEAAQWLSPFVAQTHKNRQESIVRRETNLLHGRNRGRETDGTTDGIADGLFSTKRTESQTESRTRNGRNDGLTRDKGISSLSPRSTDSLRSSALGFGEWPQDNDGLRKLAKFFMAAFGNCRDPETSSRHVSSYMQVLAQMRSRGVSIEVAWKACADARDANPKPLFGASIKSAMAYIPPRPGPGVDTSRGGLRVVTREMLDASAPDDLIASIRASQDAAEARYAG